LFRRSHIKVLWGLDEPIELQQLGGGIPSAPQKLDAAPVHPAGIQLWMISMNGSHRFNGIATT
jgi:hypothetical protein